MTLYTRALSLNIVKSYSKITKFLIKNSLIVRRIWDLYFLDGFSVLFTAALAILKLLKDQLLYAELEDIMKVLKDAQYSITDEKEFIETLHLINLPKWIRKELNELSL
jgi:hypothetical protein